VLVTEVDGNHPRLRHRAGPLKGSDRLADARLAAEQDDLSLPDPSRQHVVEAVEAGRHHGVIGRLGELMQLGERGQRGTDLRTPDDEIRDDLRHRQTSTITRTIDSSPRRSSSASSFVCQGTGALCAFFSRSASSQLTNCEVGGLDLRFLNVEE
jgi:hypothetical protein